MNKLINHKMIYNKNLDFNNQIYKKIIQNKIIYNMNNYQTKFNNQINNYNIYNNKQSYKKKTRKYKNNILKIKLNNRE